MSIPRQHGPAPPRPAHLRAIELVSRSLARAPAVGSRVEFVPGDVRRADSGSADGVVLLDVLQYIEYAEQRRILQRARAALGVDGVLLLRVGNAVGGFRFSSAKWVDSMLVLMYGRGFKPR